MQRFVFILAALFGGVVLLVQADAQPPAGKAAKDFSNPPIVTANGSSSAFTGSDASIAALSVLTAAMHFSSLHTNH